MLAGEELAIFVGISMIVLLAIATIAVNIMTIIAVNKNRKK